MEFIPFGAFLHKTMGQKKLSGAGFRKGRVVMLSGVPVEPVHIVAAPRKTDGVQTEATPRPNKQNRVGSSIFQI